MKKIKREWLIIIALILILSAIILSKELTDLDEIWNYNFARNIVEARLPYKDFNIIIMPLFPYICSIFLWLFGNEIIVMRILAIALCIGILYMAYKVLDKTKASKQISCLFLIGLIYLFKEHFRIDYNFLVLFVILTIMYIEMTKPKPILLGILAGLCICTKQTIGILVAIVLVGYKIVEVSSKEEFKKYIKDSLYRIIGILIPILILAIYFSISGIWEDFIDYCIKGISTFTNTIPYNNLIENGKLPIKILSVLVPVFLLGSIIYLIIQKIRKKEIDRNLLTITAYSLASIIVVYPIADEIHFLVGALPSMIGIIYIIDNLIQKIVDTKKTKTIMFVSEFLNIATILWVVVLAVLSINPLCEYLKIASENQELKHFKYIPQPEGQVESINEIDAFIKSQKKQVYILDAVSALYNIPIDRYTKNYDMFNKGNLGGSGENGIIEELENQKDIILLIRNDKYNRNWQNPEEVRNYVIQNIEKTGEIGIFDIYEK